MNDNISILGGGSWGCALASMLSKEGKDVTLWVRSHSQYEEIAKRRTNSKYLPGVSIPDSLKVTDDLEEAVKKAVAQIGGFHEVKKVEDIVEIMNYGVMSTPALVVDGIVKSSGKLLSIDEIINLLKGK